MTVSSAMLAPNADRPLTPAMVRAVWQIAAELDRMRVPTTVDQAVWVLMPTAEVRGDDARNDNVWLRQAMRRLTGVTLSGETRLGRWGAVLVAQWEIISGGSILRVLVPPAAVAAMRAPATFAKLDTGVAYSLPPHGQRLYAYIADRARQSRPYADMALDELRVIMGVEQRASYEVWGQLRKRVLDPAVQAVNAAGALEVSYAMRKTGRTVTGVTLRWQWRDPVGAADAVEQQDRHSAASGKAAPTNAVSAAAPPLIEGDEARLAWNLVEQALGKKWAAAWGPSLRVSASDGVVTIDGTPVARNEVRGHPQLRLAEQRLADSGWVLVVAD